MKVMLDTTFIIDYLRQAGSGRATPVPSMRPVVSRS